MICTGAEELFRKNINIFSGLNPDMSKMRGNGNQINSSEDDKRNLSMRKETQKNKPDLSIAQPTFTPIFNSMCLLYTHHMPHPAPSVNVILHLLSSVNTEKKKTDPFGGFYMCFFFF